jgi:hypothetical protein
VTTPSRGAELAAGLVAAAAEVAEFVRGCDDQTWARSTAAECWPVGVVARHIAAGNQLIGGWIEATVAGRGVTVTAAEVDAVNARNLELWRGCTREDVLAELGGIDTLATLITALSDDDLERSAPFGPAGGREIPALQLCEAAERHQRTHLESMRAAR